MFLELHLIRYQVIIPLFLMSYVNHAQCIEYTQNINQIGENGIYKMHLLWLNVSCGFGSIICINTEFQTGEEIKFNSSEMFGVQTTIQIHLESNINFLI